MVDKVKCRDHGRLLHLPRRFHLGFHHPRGGKERWTAKVQHATRSLKYYILLMTSTVPTSLNTSLTHTGKTFQHYACINPDSVLSTFWFCLQLFTISFSADTHIRAR